jgi:diacylglycerol kinase family enzyme
MLGTLIASPLASRLRDGGERGRVIRDVAAAMRASGATRVEVREAGDPILIRATAAAAVEAGSGLVVVAGGDGTVRDAAGPLTGTGIPVGIVPCGTGNLYATAVGIPRDLGRAIEVIRGGRSAAVDVGSVRMTPGAGTTGGGDVQDAAFVVACGTGLDARLIAATSRDAKRRYGVAAYFLAASRLLGDLAPRPTVLEVDGVRKELESVVVLVANCGEAIPGRLRPRLPIRPDDGLLHVFVLPRGGLLGGIRGTLELMLADAEGESVSGSGIRLMGRHVRVTVSPPGPTQVDGDVFAPSTLDARIHAGGLRVLRP